MTREFKIWLNLSVMVLIGSFIPCLILLTESVSLFLMGVSLCSIAGLLMIIPICYRQAKFERSLKRMNEAVANLIKLVDNMKP